MYELRWVQNGTNVQLQFRQREVMIDNWGDVRHVKDWGEWQVVPIFLAEGSQPQDGQSIEMPPPKPPSEENKIYE